MYHILYWVAGGIARLRERSFTSKQAGQENEANNLTGQAIFGDLVLHTADQSLAGVVTYPFSIPSQQIVLHAPITKKSMPGEVDVTAKPGCAERRVNRQS